MKTFSITLLALLMAGCSIHAEDPPLADQTHDLMDADADGVINARDFCADTPLGAVIDNRGCPTFDVAGERNKLHILFPNDVDTVPQGFYTQIQSMGDFLAKYPTTYVTLNGYASPVGADDYNLALSERRSANVKEALIKAGVAPDRIKTASFGETKPVQAQSQEEVNTLSRRVTATVSDTSSSVKKQWTIFDERAE